MEMVQELTYVLTLSCIDLTLVSNNLANSCEWNINDSTSIRSDHFPIICSINVKIDIQERPRHEKCDFPKADWQKYVVNQQIYF